MNATVPNHQPDGPPPPRFGRISPVPAREAFRHVLNQEMIDFLRSLPRSTHADAVVFFMQHLGTAFIPVFDFFRHYHAPAWSILYWMAQRDAPNPLPAQCYDHARRAHAMALFLHPLDDHLNDGQLPPTHLHLLLRSQAWRIMLDALEPLASKVVGGQAVVRRFLDDYYASIATPPALATLDGYSTHFRQQMATWLIVPVLLARWQSAAPALAETLQHAYGAFGIAWRLLDDWQDIAPDRRSGAPSAVYYALPKDLRGDWRLPTEGSASGQDRVADCLMTGLIQDTIRKRIYQELALAAELVAPLGMGGLTSELHAMAHPFRDEAGRL